MTTIIKNMLDILSAEFLVTKKGKSAIAFFISLITMLALGINSQALAIPDDLRINALNLGQSQWPPGVAVPPGPPPPIGDGPVPDPVVSGDAPGSEQRPPSRTAQTKPVTGSWFTTIPSRNVTLTNYKMNIPPQKPTLGKPRPRPYGPHIVLTNNTGGGGTQNITEDTLVQMQEAQYPSPYKGMGAPGGKKKLSLDFQLQVQQRPRPKQDSPPFQLTFGNNSRDNSNNLSVKSKLIKVRQFARFLVKLGVVFATVMLIIASLAVMFGHRDGGARVVSVVGGLMLLLSAYTIWKQVMLDTHYFGNYTPNNPDQIIPRPEPNREAPQPANTPGVPGGARTVPPRTNMKVLPLGASTLR